MIPAKLALSWNRSRSDKESVDVLPIMITSLALVGRLSLLVKYITPICGCWLLPLFFAALVFVYIVHFTLGTVHTGIKTFCPLCSAGDFWRHVGADRPVALLKPADQPAQLHWSPALPLAPLDRPQPPVTTA